MSSSHVDGCLCDSCFVPVKGEKDCKRSSEQSLVVVKERARYPGQRHKLPFKSGVVQKVKPHHGQFHAHWYSHRTYDSSTGKWVNVQTTSHYRKLSVAHNAFLDKTVKTAHRAALARGGRKVVQNFAKKGKARKEKGKPQTSKGNGVVIADVAQGVSAFNPGAVMTAVTAGTNIIGMIIDHKEEIATVFNALNEVVIQPGIEAVLPWLGRVAKGYTDYEVLEMEPVVETMRPTSDPGRVTAAFNYDATAKNYDDVTPEELSQQLSSFSGAASGPVWATEIKAGVTPSQIMSTGKSKLIRDAPVAAPSQLYDAGRILVNVEGLVDGAGVPLPPTTEVGKLVLKYKIKLLNPKTEDVEDNFTTTLLSFEAPTTFRTLDWATWQPIWDTAASIEPVAILLPFENQFVDIGAITYMELPKGFWRVGARGGWKLSAAPLLNDTQLIRYVRIRCRVLYPDTGTTEEFSLFLDSLVSLDGVLVPAPSRLGEVWFTDNIGSDYADIHVTDSAYITFDILMSGLFYDPVGPPIGFAHCSNGGGQIKMNIYGHDHVNLVGFDEPLAIYLKLN